MYEHIHCMRNGRMRQFRKRYREECDVLLLDDIQFIANSGRVALRMIVAGSDRGRTGLMPPTKSSLNS